MSRRQPDLIAPWRGIALILATLALSLKLIIPAGFMASPTAPFELVLCVDQGVVTVDEGSSGDPRHDPGPASHDKPCAFAGHGAALTAPSLLELTEVSFAGYAEPAPQPHASAAPGRGLAAPPPPSRGPPSLLT